MNETVASMNGTVWIFAILTNQHGRCSGTFVCKAGT